VQKIQKSIKINIPQVEYEEMVVQQHSETQLFELCDGLTNGMYLVIIFSTWRVLCPFHGSDAWGA
jgi:hypothetical protein